MLLYFQLVYINIRKTQRFVSKQVHREPRFLSWARKLGYNCKMLYVTLLKNEERSVFQKLVNSPGKKSLQRDGVTHVLNCKKVHPDHDNIRYTDLKAPMGFEPMTSCLLDRRSNHLSYGAMLRLCV